MTTTPSARGRVSRRRFLQHVSAYAVSTTGALALSGCGGGGSSSGSGPFQHGVASGDPLSDRVILWTRISEASGNVDVRWELAANPTMSPVLQSGTATTTINQDFTVKVDVAGLAPGTVYYYRFVRGSTPSQVGRTKTLPVGAAVQARLAVFSCAAYAAGQFHAYADAARRGDFDAALHLGDYIYEYSNSGSQGFFSGLLARSFDPDNELITLDDYRKRHRQARTDADLRAMCEAMPLIAVWDDHDVVNGAWSGGASGHADMPSYPARRANAIQAWQEWLPIRLPDPTQPLKIYRSFDFGTLATLHMLDTRHIGRDQQMGRDQALSGAIDAPSRQLLGQEQQNALLARMQGSAATWQVLGSQVLMARMKIPLSVYDNFTQDSISEVLAAQDTPPAQRTQRQNDLLAQPQIGYNLDAWDGYTAARETVFAAARAGDKNLVVVAGDSHNAWASDLKDSAGTSVGVEFACQSVTSPGFEASKKDIGRQFLTAAFPRLVAGGTLKYCQTSDRGYLVLTLTPTEARSDWVFVSSVFANDRNASVQRSLRMLPGSANRVLVEA